MEEEAARPFKVFVGLVSRLGLAPGFGRWVAGPLRFENTFKLSKNKGEMEIVWRETYSFKPLMWGSISTSTRGVSSRKGGFGNSRRGVSTKASLIKFSTSAAMNCLKRRDHIIFCIGIGGE